MSHHFGNVSLVFLRQKWHREDAKREIASGIGEDLFEQSMKSVHRVNFGTKTESGSTDTRASISLFHRASASKVSNAGVNTSRAGRSPGRSCSNMRMRRLFRRQGVLDRLIIEDRI